MRTTVALTIAAVGAVSLLGVLSVVSLGRGALWIPFFPCAQRVVYEGSTGSSWTSSACAPQDQVDAAMRAAIRGDPLPAGFTLTSFDERVIARTTGELDWLGRHEVEVDVRTRASDLDSIRLYLNDRLVSEADDKNGCLFRWGDDAEAVLSFFAPWWPRYTVKLVTRTRDGKESCSSITIGGSVESSGTTRRSLSTRRVRAE